jgi:Ser/Thr protein kinase RdoA (MazF antagonist)
MVTATDVKERIELKYEFNYVTCQLLDSTRNKLYQVNNYATKYIFKIYDKNRELELINGEVELVLALEKRGSIVSFPVRDLDGNWIQEFQKDEQIWYGVLFTFAEGQVCQKLSDRQLIMLGHELAIFHNISCSLNLEHKLNEYTLSTLLIEPLKILQPAFVHLESEYSYLKEISTKIIIHLAKLNLSRFDFGYVHGDLKLSNIHFEGDEKMIFFNFDLAGGGFILQDIIGIYLHYFDLIRSGESTPDEANHSYNLFFSSYYEIRKLSDNELQAIPYMAAAIFIYAIYFSYIHLDQKLFPKFLDDHLQRLKEWTSSPMFN